MTEVSVPSEQRAFLREKAVDLILSMVSLFLERIENSLEKESSKGLSTLVSDDVDELLPALKIWTDWMSCQMQIWSSPMKPEFFSGYLQHFKSCFSNLSVCYLL